jgi:hypothetical protein
MSALGNVVQIAGRNVCAGAAAASAAAQMDCVTGEVSTMGAAGEQAAGGLDRAAAGAADTVPADAESAVNAAVSLGNEAKAAPCHTACHKVDGMPGDLAAGRLVVSEGGRGSRPRAASVPTIGFQRRQNFANVHAVALTEQGAILGRDLKTGGLVIVPVAKGVDLSTLVLPTVLGCAKKEGGGLVFEGPAPAWKCPQCWLPTPHDCMERPCGWQDAPKKKEGAA